jgi:hypothetical protein
MADGGFGYSKGQELSSNNAYSTTNTNLKEFCSRTYKPYSTYLQHNQYKQTKGNFGHVPYDTQIKFHLYIK